MLEEFLEHPFFLKMSPASTTAERTRAIPQPPAATRNQPQSAEESFWGIAAGDASSEAHRDARCVAGGNPGSGALLGARATRESEGTVIRQLRFILRICGEEMAAIPWTAQSAERTPYAVRRSTQLLRPAYDRGAGSFALFGALSSCEDIEVPGVVRRTASLVDEGEDRRCGRVPVPSPHPMLRRSIQTCSFRGQGNHPAEGLGREPERTRRLTLDSPTAELVIPATT